MPVAFVCKIGEHFVNVTDPRVNRGTNFPLDEMVFVAARFAIATRGSMWRPSASAS